MERGWNRRMNPRGIGIPLVLAAVLVPACTPEACTSFVEYASGGAWYGMNFDWYPDQEILFRIETDMEGGRVFTMAFIDAGDTLSTAGMTADGRFSTLQVTDAEWTGPDPDEGTPMIYWPFYALIYRGASMDDVADMVAIDTYSQYDDPPLHVITADASGRAMIIEVGADGNDILERGGRPFMAMTNFHSCSWAGRDPALIEGCGADRYRSALRALKDRLGAMSPEAGMAVLEAAENLSPDFPTRASMVFDATRARVYIAVSGEFEDVRVLDIATGLLESWPDGGGDPLLIGEQGITASEILSGD
ncbi:MAG: hypothetical protein QUS11_06135 [Candidatus Fermentibacter sp.]|nr:hypothetical protein [Candidatus Fermentibacter sp.]